jgi:hypothetical protein
MAALLSDFTVTNLNNVVNFYPGCLIAVVKTLVARDRQQHP